MRRATGGSRHGWAGLAGGAVAGALGGWVEGLSIWAADPAAGASAPLYGTIFYGALLAPVGLVLGLALGFLARERDEWTARWAWSVSLIALLTPLALAVGQFRVVRDVFHEKLPLASAAGVGVHAGLLLAAAALAWGLWRLTNPNGKRPLQRASAARLTLGALGFLALTAAPTLLTGGKEAPPVPETTARSGPVILIMVDTLRADRLSTYGYKKPTSPNLDAFAKDAVVFENHFANASWTRPSTASLLTSLPPSAHKTMYKADRLPDGVESVGEAFKAAGYNTGGIVTNYNIAPYFNFAQGFDEYTYLEPDYYFWADEGSSKLALFNVVRVLREKVWPAADRPDFYYRDAKYTTQAAKDWISRRKDKPFFLFLTYMDPHDPYFTHPLSGESYSRAATVNPDPALAPRLSAMYDGEIYYWDHYFGQLVQWLKQEGLYEKATIAITSDHGEEFQEHGGWWHGTSLYEEQIHIPLVIKRPGHASAGTRRPDLTTLIDVPPTLLAVSGAGAPRSWMGRDLFGERPAPTTVFSEEDHQGNALRAVRAKDWKLIEANSDNPRGLAPLELYQMVEDPAEKKNRAQTDLDKLKEMKTALEDASKGVHAVEVKRDQGEVDEESRRMLEKLGYVEESTPTPKPPTDKPDAGPPKPDAPPADAGPPKPDAAPDAP